jgi:GTP cyclohydrolase IB
VNSLTLTELHDVQNQADDRGLRIDEVGIDGLRLPVRMARPGGTAQPTVASIAMNVELEAGTKGTHMSRFVEVIGSHTDAIDGAALAGLARTLQSRLDTMAARISLEFPYFLDRAAPVTGGAAPVEYTGRLYAEAREGVAIRVGAHVPVASLCPCSKEISDYGAHNQRGYVDIDVLCSDGATVWIDDLIDAAEAAASAPVYALLKRPDERFVTMQAYEKPAFVEDIARDVALVLCDDARIQSFTVSVRNLESIHAHDAVATIRGRR